MNLKSHCLSLLDSHRETGSFLQSPKVGRGRTQFPLTQWNCSGLKIKLKCWAGGGPRLLPSQALGWISPSRVWTESFLLQIKNKKIQLPQDEWCKQRLILLILPLGVVVHGLGLLLGNKRINWEKRQNSSFPFLPTSKALGLWFPLLLQRGSEDGHREGGRIHHRTQHSDGPEMVGELWIGMKDDKTWRIPRDPSTGSFKPSRHSPLARTQGIRNAVSGKWRQRRSRQIWHTGPTNNYAPWEHRLLQIG